MNIVCTICINRKVCTGYEYLWKVKWDIDNSVCLWRAEQGWGQGVRYGSGRGLYILNYWSYIT